MLSNDDIRAILGPNVDVCEQYVTALRETAVAFVSVVRDAAPPVFQSTDRRTLAVQLVHAALDAVGAQDGRDASAHEQPPHGPRYGDVLRAKRRQ